MFLVKPVSSRYFRKVLVTTSSTEMTKGCTDTLLNFQNFFYFQGHVVFSNFLCISAGKVMGKVNYRVVFPEDGGDGCSRNMTEFSLNVYLSAYCWTNLGTIT